MEERLKQPYEAPTVLVVEVKTEGIICGSMKDYKYYDYDE
jgi:hypothetical protein